VSIVLAFTGLRWEEAAVVPISNVRLEDQSMIIDRTASESGGRRDVREDMKTRAAVRTVMIPTLPCPPCAAWWKREHQAGNAAKALSTVA
jgi:hypothetical protein